MLQRPLWQKILIAVIAVVGDVLANEPIYYGLAASLIAYVAGSLVTKRTPAEVLEVWDARLAGRDTADTDRVAT